MALQQNRRASQRGPDLPQRMSASSKLHPGLSYHGLSGPAWQQLLVNETLAAEASSQGRAVWARLRSLALLVPRTMWGEPWRNGRSQEVCRKAEGAKLVQSRQADGETHSNKILPWQ